MRWAAEEIRLEIPEDVPSVVEFLEDRLYDSNARATGRYDGRLFSWVVRDEQGKVAAGVAGWTWAGVCEITQLWVSTDAQNRGVGTLLLRAAEEHAQTQGCSAILVKTYSFQAPGFYQKHGYQTESVIEGFPEGHQYYLLRKTL
jgi:ribosomal protein S18 acetylase RimI-like enzyme